MITCKLNKVYTIREAILNFIVGEGEDTQNVHVTAKEIRGVLIASSNDVVKDRIANNIDFEIAVHGGYIHPNLHDTVYINVNATIELYVDNPTGELTLKVNTLSAGPNDYYVKGPNGIFKVLKYSPYLNDSRLKLDFNRFKFGVVSIVVDTYYKTHSIEEQSFEDYIESTQSKSK